MTDIEAACKSLTAALVNALDSPTIEALGNIFAQPNVVNGRSYSSRVAEVLVPRLEALDYKWLDPECIGKGCQSLVWKGRYESAVKGRADFRDAYREARSPAGMELAIENERLRNTLKLHAGDTLSLSNEADEWRDRALEAEEALAASRALVEQMRSALDSIAGWRNVNISNEYESGLRDIIHSVTDCASAALDTATTLPSTEGK